MSSLRLELGRQSAAQADTLRAVRAANPKCADCVAQYTQYIVLEFGVWVCAECGQAHRKLGHAVKSPTMAQFKV
jgi:ribosomal protein L37AE/L43A